MTVEEYQAEIQRIISHENTLMVNVSPDFQCDQTGGFPTSLCVCWEHSKAWLQPNEFFDATPEQFRKAWQDCADYGFKHCIDDEDYNNILKSLGEDAYNTACLSDDENIGQDLS